MSLVSQWRGPIKSGKTESVVYYAIRLAGKIGCPVYTNLTECWIRDKDSPDYGKAWAQTVKIDDLIDDMRHTKLEDATFKLAVLVIDEAPIYWETNMMRSTYGGFLTAFMGQAGKRGMPILYTCHLRNQVAPRVRKLTEMSVRCTSLNYGRIVDWDVFDEKAIATALDEGENPPEPVSHRLDNRDGKLFLYYDTNEVVSPLEGAESVLAPKSLRNAVKELNKRRATLYDIEHSEHEAVSESREFAEAAATAAKDIMAETPRKGPKRVGLLAGGKR